MLWCPFHAFFTLFLFSIFAASIFLVVVPAVYAKPRRAHKIERNTEKTCNAIRRINLKKEVKAEEEAIEWFSAFHSIASQLVCTNRRMKNNLIYSNSNRLAFVRRMLFSQLNTLNGLHFGLCPSNPNRRIVFIITKRLQPNKTNALNLLRNDINRTNTHSKNTHDIDYKTLEKFFSLQLFHFQST